MKILVILFLTLLLLIGIGSVIPRPGPVQTVQASQTSRSSDTLGDALAGLAASTTSFFISINDAICEVDVAVQNATPFVRAIFGLFKCFSGLLALFGVFSLTSARQAYKRFLS